MSTMRPVPVAFLALAALGAASIFTAAKADSAIMQERDALGMSNDWNGYKYHSQGIDSEGKYFCNVPNCVNKLEEDGIPRSGHH